MKQSHFTYEEISLEKLNNLLQVMQLITAKAQPSEFSRYLPVTSNIHLWAVYWNYTQVEP